MDSAKEIWNKVLGELQLQVSKANYATWLSNTRGLDCRENVFVVGVPNIFVAEWLSQRLYPLIRKTLVSIMAADVDVRFVVQTPDYSVNGTAGNHTDGGTSSKATRHKFNPKYTFDNFVVSDCNRLAYASALEVAENPGNSYNPLFIYAGTGLGKTHLLHAIGHLTTSNGLQVLYITAEQFANEFVLAAKEKEIDKFRTKFKDIHVLLVDDLHFLIDKKQTLQCFFQIFNDLHNNNHQIVITADCAPKEMQLPSSKLKSRLEGGLVVDIQPPDFETRLNILRSKLETNVTPELEAVLYAIAEKVTENVRQLEGALAYITAQANLNGASLSPQIINKVLTSVTGKKNAKMILQSVADHFDVPFQDLTGKGKDKKTVLARQVAIYLMREELNYSLAQIGRELGGRHHATILHAYNKICQELTLAPRLASQVAEVRAKIWASEQVNQHISNCGRTTAVSGKLVNLSHLR